MQVLSHPPYPLLLNIIFLSTYPLYINIETILMLYKMVQKYLHCKIISGSLPLNVTDLSLY